MMKAYLSIVVPILITLFFFIGCIRGIYWNLPLLIVLIGAFITGVAIVRSVLDKKNRDWQHKHWNLNVRPYK